MRHDPPGVPGAEVVVQPEGVAVCLPSVVPAEDVEQVVDGDLAADFVDFLAGEVDERVVDPRVRGVERLESFFDGGFAGQGGHVGDVEQGERVGHLVTVTITSSRSIHLPSTFT